MRQRPVRIAPLYSCVSDEIKQRIRSGLYPPGSTLPSETKLVDEFGVSLITVRRALHDLALEGLIDRRQGLGSFVRHPAQHVLIGLTNFTYDVQSGSLDVERTLLRYDMLPLPEEVAQRLKVRAGSVTRHLVRLDSHAGIPFSIDEVWIPPAFVPFITPEVAASPAFFALWQSRAGLVPERNDYELKVEMPSSADQESLQIGPDLPLLICVEVTYDVSGNPSEWVETRYRGDRTRLVQSVILPTEVKEFSVAGHQPAGMPSMRGPAELPEASSTA